MPPRGNRLVCTLRTADGAQAIYDVHAGEQPNSVASIEAVKWTKPSTQPVLSAAFVIIGDLGLTGKAVQLNEEQWRALTRAKLEPFFYAAILWDGNPAKVVEDAMKMLKRGR
jgi:hypothetical protein